MPVLGGIGLALLVGILCCVKIRFVLKKRIGNIMTKNVTGRLKRQSSLEGVNDSQESSASPDEKSSEDRKKLVQRMQENIDKQPERFEDIERNTFPNSTYEGLFRFGLPNLEPPKPKVAGTHKSD